MLPAMISIKRLASHGNGRGVLCINYLVGRSTTSRSQQSRRLHVPGNKHALDILVVGDPFNPILSELSSLRDDANIIGVFNDISEVLSVPDKVEELLLVNTIFNVSGNASTISGFIPLMPSLSWVHSITAGLDHIWCEALMKDQNIRVSNTKGVFSYTLAEHVMAACLYYAKDIQKLEKQRQDKNWNRFYMSELRGATMGIVGYGDIGRACAKLAKPFGMHVSAYRRRPELCVGDELIDHIYKQGELKDLMASSDYIVVCAPLTADTIDLISADELRAAKPGQVIINIGRGPIINEKALILELVSGERIKGCALDVFNEEPLPQKSDLWTAPNVLLSPHNADFTQMSRILSVRNFVSLCDKIVMGEPIVYADKQSGY